jgi:5-formyltetrahydrofolate cyclo-ligase
VALLGNDRNADRAWTKARWRRELRAARFAVPGRLRFAEAIALSRQLTSGRIVRPGQTLCAYVPVGSEPGAAQMLDDIAEFGVRMLLPVVAGRGPLEWAWYAGPDSLRPGPFGLREPIGERLSTAALRIADLVLVPALAVDLTGVRLGQGAGYYDQSLPLAAPGTPMVAVVRDQEVVDRLPVEPHDVRMTAAVTPNRGLIRFD